ARRCSLFRKNGTESCVLALSPHDGSRGAARRVPWDGGQKLAEAGPDLHRLGQRDVAAGVESPGELVGMVVKIGLDGVPAPVPWVLAVLVVTAEACGKLRLAAVGDVSDPPGHAKAAVGAVAGPGVVVVAASPAAVGPDGVQLRRGPGDLLG